MDLNSNKYILSTKNDILNNGLALNISLRPSKTFMNSSRSLSTSSRAHLYVSRYTKKNIIQNNPSYTYLDQYQYGYFDYQCAMRLRWQERINQRKLYLAKEYAKQQSVLDYSNVLNLLETLSFNEFRQFWLNFPQKSIHQNQLIDLKKQGYFNKISFNEFLGFLFTYNINNFRLHFLIMCAFTYDIHNKFKRHDSYFHFHKNPDKMKLDRLILLNKCIKIINRNAKRFDFLINSQVNLVEKKKITTTINHLAHTNILKKVNFNRRYFHSSHLNQAVINNNGETMFHCEDNKPSDFTTCNKFTEYLLENNINNYNEIYHEAIDTLKKIECLDSKILLSIEQKFYLIALREHFYELARQITII
jgi:hypothetical protein